MRITFLMPGYTYGPSGGFRIVYEYANQLVTRGHQVSVVHPRRLKYLLPLGHMSPYRHLRAGVTRVINRFVHPSVDWHSIDPRVRMEFVPDSSREHIPDGDVLFATAWHTVRSVLECPETKGEKVYFIQGYETFSGPKDLVDATWRAPLHKIATAKWLIELGRDLGCHDIVHMPNAFNQSHYSLKRPLRGRSPRVAMMFSSAPIKGAADGIEALRIARERYPSLDAVFFGVGRRQGWIPKWIEYYQNPSQQFIVDRILNGSSVFLSPSWTEGFALPPAEAACCGCAIVASDSGGIREYVHHGSTGLLSVPKDPKALAQNLCLLLGNEDLRVQLATACQTLLRDFTWKRSTDRLETFLTDVLQYKKLQLAR